MDDDSPYDIRVAVEYEGSNIPIDESELRRAIERTLSRHGCASASLSVALVDDARIAVVNDQYLGHQGPTDVISFDLSDDERPDDRVDGELVISIETAWRESESRPHGPAAELALYAVHGTLHLLGFDDQTEAAAGTMHAEEDRILDDLGYGRVYQSGGR